jgi:hypothetical protein
MVARRVVRLGDFRMVVNGMWRAVDDDVPKEEARVRVSVRWKGKRRRFQCLVYRDVLIPHADNAPGYREYVANRTVRDFVYLLGLCFENEPQRLFDRLDSIAHFNPQRLFYPTASRVCQGLAQIGAVAKALLTAYNALDAAAINYFVAREPESLAKFRQLVGEALIAFACDQRGVELDLVVAVKQRLENAA